MIEKVSIKAIRANPNNPRVIRDDKFRKLVKSINDFPEMLELRPIVVNDEMVVLGGNMRLKACKEAGLGEVAIIKASNLSEAQQAEFIIKDNAGFGEWDWDILANEYDEQDLKDWGMDMPLMDKIDNLEEGEQVEIERSLQVIPKKEYIIIMEDEDSDEWIELKSIFKCGTVRQGGCKIESTSDKATTGMERVFDLKTFKERIFGEF
jgi:ParB-like chromosome segregation protein Spo0J